MAWTGNPGFRTASRNQRGRYRVTSIIQRRGGSKLKKQQLLLLLLIVIAVVIPCAAVYGDSFRKEPYIVANNGLEWWSDAAHNAARNEYCMTWENGYIIHWIR